MLKQHPLLPLFEKFISHSKTGRRLNKNDSRIKIQTVQNYSYCLKLLEEYATNQQTTLIIHELKGTTSVNMPC